MLDLLQITKKVNGTIELSIHNFDPKPISTYQKIFEKLKVPVSSVPGVTLDYLGFPVPIIDMITIQFENIEAAESAFNQFFRLLKDKNKTQEWSKVLLEQGIDYQAKSRALTVATAQITVLEAFYRANQESQLKESVLPLLPLITSLTYTNPPALDFNKKKFPPISFFERRFINDNPATEMKSMCKIL